MKLSNQFFFKKKKASYLPLTTSGKTFLAFSVYLEYVNHIIVLNNHICSPNLIR